MNTINQTNNTNSRNPQMKMNINVSPEQFAQAADHNMQHSSLEHLNRSLNMH